MFRKRLCSICRAREVRAPSLRCNARSILCTTNPWQKDTGRLQVVIWVLKGTSVMKSAGEVSDQTFVAAANSACCPQAARTACQSLPLESVSSRSQFDTPTCQFRTFTNRVSQIPEAIANQRATKCVHSLSSSPPTHIPASLFSDSSKTCFL